MQLLTRGMKERLTNKCNVILINLSVYQNPDSSKT